MRRAKVFVNKYFAGRLSEKNKKEYYFEYEENYQGSPISLTMPIDKKIYIFDKFPPFFDGLLPEGPQLEALLKSAKLDRDDYFSQLLAVGEDLVGAVSVMYEEK